MIAAIDLAKILHRFQITSKWVFFPLAGLFVGYLLYTMIRRRHGERPGNQVHEPEL